MISLEQRAQQMTDDGKEFWQFCELTFGSGVGASVLAQLIRWSSPLESPMAATVEETHVNIGRKEVIALLWRRSQRQFTPEHIPEPVKTPE